MRVVNYVIAVFVLVGSLMIGMAALLVVAGVGLVAGIALWLRVTWIRHKLRKSGVDLNAEMNPGVNPQRASGDVIDAEYTVVSVQDNHKDT